MTKKKYCVAAAASIGGALTMQDWLFILSLLLSILGMLRDYIKEREKK